MISDDECETFKEKIAKLEAELEWIKSDSYYELAAFNEGLKEGLERAAQEAESWFKDEYVHDEHTLIKISGVIAEAIRRLKNEY